MKEDRVKDFKCETAQTVEHLKDLLITSSATKSDHSTDSVTNNEQSSKKGSKKKKEPSEVMTSSSGLSLFYIGGIHEWRHANFDNF